MVGTKTPIEEQQFLYVKQSQGSVFETPFVADDDLKNETNCIGTFDCWNCVCVYIPINKKLCFVAHIDAWACLYTPNEDHSDMIPPKGSETSLKDCVKQMLKEEVLPFIPNGKLDDEMNSRAIILNMRPTVAYHGVSTKATGFYIAEAIQEFFDLRGSSEDQHATGFVVNHATTEREYFRWKKGAAVPTARDYDMWAEHTRSTGKLHPAAIEEDSNRVYPEIYRRISCRRQKTWRFGYHEGKWYPRKVLLSKGWWVKAAWDDV